MILIETSTFDSFGEYLVSLSKSARKNYHYVTKHNHCEYQQFAFSDVKIQKWMDLWEKQLIRGEYRQYAFRADALKDKNILCFEAIENETIGVQFVEVIDGYMNCHPVMYEKDKYSKRYLSKFMWFNLIKWAIENEINIVDLGGGNDDSWHEMIRTRKQYPNPAYKWMYVPGQVKFNPESQQNYKVEHDGISKRISKLN